MKYIYITLFILLFFNCYFSIDLPDNQYYCLDSLTATINVIGETYTFNSSQERYEYCPSSSFLCIFNNVTSVSLKNFEGTLSPTQLNCLPYLMFLSVQTGLMQKNFFSSNVLTPTNLMSIQLINLKNDVEIAGLALSRLSYFDLRTSIPSIKNFSLSELKYINTLNIQYIGSDQSPLWLYNNDLQSFGNRLNQWSIVAYEIPSFNNLPINNLDILLTSNLTSQNTLNYLYFTHIINLSIKPYINQFEINFPTEIFQYERSNNQTIKFEIPFKSPNIFLNLDDKITNSLSILILSNAGKNFNVNGQFPFINCKQTFSLLSKLYFNNGNIKILPNLEIFGNLKYLNLSNNLIEGVLPEFDKSKSGLSFLSLSNNLLSGTIPKSWCELGEMDFSNNNLTGTIPNCFTCFPFDSPSKFDGNNLDYKYPDICYSIIPNLKYSQGCFYLFGEDLGSGVYFKTEPVINGGVWEVLVPNKRFKACDPSIKPTDIFSLTYTPTYSYNFRLFPLSTNPKINSVIISVYEQLTFLGQYFSYNTSIVSVTINGVNCDVVHSTFEAIVCNFKDLESYSNPLLAIVKIEDMSTQISFNSNNKTNNISECIPECNSNSYCSSDVGMCKCNQDYTGSSCEVYKHYAASVESVSINGGLVNIYGSFGSNHTEPSVMISEINKCEIISINSSTIQCNLSPPILQSSETFQLLNITQNGISWISKYLFQFLTLEKLKCPNDCNPKSNIKSGECDTTTGFCQCRNGFTGSDCGSIFNSTTPISNTTINDNGKTTISNDFTTFNVLITKLYEINYDGTINDEFNLENNWKPISSSNNQFTTFSQKLKANKGSVEFTLEEILENEKNFEFAGTKFKMDKGSIKISINISNYQFSNQLNTLELEMKSILDPTSSSNDCNSNDKSINILNEQSLNYVSMQKDKKVLYSRFINKVLSNGKPTLINTKIVEDSSNDNSASSSSSSSSGITISMSLPHCTESCLIDPDYSLLLEIDHQSCNSGENKSNSKLSKTSIIAIVVSITGAFIIIATVILIYRKYKVENDLPNKLKKLNKN